MYVASHLHFSLGLMFLCINSIVSRHSHEVIRYKLNIIHNNFRVSTGLV